MPGQRCGFCAGSGRVEIHFATVWDGLKWHLYRALPFLSPAGLGRVRYQAPPDSPEGT
jgi:hypothetical protein